MTEPEKEILEDAIRKNDIPKAKALLEKDPSKKEIPLHSILVPAREGHKEMLALLLDHSQNEKTEKQTALMEACEYGKTQSINLLLDRGADPNAPEGYNLQWATAKNHPEAVKLLLARGANPAIKNHLALQEAFDNKLPEIARILLPFCPTEILKKLHQQRTPMASEECEKLILQEIQKRRNQKLHHAKAAEPELEP